MGTRRPADWPEAEDNGQLPRRPVGQRTQLPEDKRAGPDPKRDLFVEHQARIPIRQRTKHDAAGPVEFPSETAARSWSGRQDLNLRPPGPEPGASGLRLTGLPMAGAVWRVGHGAAPSAGLEAACADRDSNGHAPADRPRQESYRGIASSHCACKRNVSRSAGLTRIAFSTRI